MRVHIAIAWTRIAALNYDERPQLQQKRVAMGDANATAALFSSNPRP